MSTDIQQLDPVTELRSRIANPALTFASDDDVNSLVAYVREQALAQSAGIDVSTATGRRQLVSVAARVAKSRVFLKAQASDVVKAMRAQIAEVAARSDRMAEELDALRDTIRDPVTKWEEAEEARVAGLQEAITSIRSLGSQAAHRFETMEQLDAASMDLAARKAVDYQEFQSDAMDAIETAKQSIAVARENLAARIKDRKEKAEMAQRLAEANEAVRKAREAEVAMTLVNRVYEIANESPGQDGDWIGRMQAEVAQASSNTHPSVQLAVKMATRALDEATAAWNARFQGFRNEIVNPENVPEAAKIVPEIQKSVPETPAAFPASVGTKQWHEQLRSRLAGAMNDRECLLGLLDAAWGAVNLLEEILDENEPSPQAYRDLKEACDLTEAYLQK